MMIKRYLLSTLIFLLLTSAAWAEKGSIVIGAQYGKYFFLKDKLYETLDMYEAHFRHKSIETFIYIGYRMNKIEMRFEFGQRIYETSRGFVIGGIQDYPSFPRMVCFSQYDISLFYRALKTFWIVPSFGLGTGFYYKNWSISSRTMEGYVHFQFASTCVNLHAVAAVDVTVWKSFSITSEIRYAYFPSDWNVEREAEPPSLRHYITGLNPGGIKTSIGVAYEFRL
jgi:hypothetical protein